MVLGKLYERLDMKTTELMYKTGKHIPEKIRNPLGGKLGYWTMIGTLMGGIVVPAFFYIGVGMVIAHNTCEVTNVVERHKTLEGVLQQD